MYEVVVVGRIAGTVRAALEDLVDALVQTPNTLVLSATDQARFVALVNRLHDLGISIEQVRRRSGR